MNEFTTFSFKILDFFAANLLLQDTIERIHVGGKYGDIPRGIFLVRGENMVLVGEIVSNLNYSNILKNRGFWCPISHDLLSDMVPEICTCSFRPTLYQK